MKHILYVGYYTDDQIMYEIQKRKINNMSVARQKFETNMLNSMIEKRRDSIDIITYVPTDGNFKIPDYSILNETQINHIGINRSSVNSLLSAKQKFEQFIFSMGEEKLHNLDVIMYDVNPIFFIPLLKLKKRYKFNITTICAELSVYRRTQRKIQLLRNRVFGHFQKKFDKYVLFAEPMAEILYCRKKPYVVVEGIAPECFGAPSTGKRNIVMYAGGLAKDNNLRLLIEACKKTSSLDELWICGVGAEQDYVEAQARTGTKIRYFGMCTNEKVRALEQEAKVLVNLRNPEEEITRYSFPSKLLEYIASGSAVLTTKLQGIPNEYFNYFFSIDQLDADAVANKMDEIFSMDDNEYVDHCLKAQAFIQTNKNANVQVEKMLNLLNQN